MFSFRLPQVSYSFTNFNNSGLLLKGPFRVGFLFPLPKESHYYSWVFLSNKQALLGYSSIILIKKSDLDRLQYSGKNDLIFTARSEALSCLIIHEYRIVLKVRRQKHLAEALGRSRYNITSVESSLGLSIPTQDFTAVNDTTCEGQELADLDKLNSF